MKQILLIDEDYIQLSEILFYITESADAQIIVAKNCSQAIDHFNQSNFDAIILDLMLPIGDYATVENIITEDKSLLHGLQLLHFFRSKNKTVKIIGFSMANKSEIKDIFQQQDALFLSKMTMGSLSKLVELINHED